MLIRSLLCAVIGVLGGSLCGALILGWNASLAEGSSFFGPAHDWWPIFAYVGALAGAAVGLGLGLCISLGQLEMRGAAIAGAIVGMIGIIALLLNIWGDYEELRSIPARLAPLILSLIIWVLLGVLLGLVATRLRRIQLGK